MGLREMQVTPFDVEGIKQRAFHEHGLVVINLNDPRLDGLDRAEAARIGTKVYGAPPVAPATAAP